VPQGANGVAVLAAAKASGCIQSYSVQDYRVTCINSTCNQQQNAQWVAYAQDPGFVECGGVITLDQFQAADGRQLYLEYENINLC
jgi:hypothetical protein